MYKIIKPLLPTFVRRHLSDVKFYLRQVQRYRKLYPDRFDTIRSIRLLPRWKSSLGDMSTPLSREMPWMTFFAVDFLETVLHADMQVFEYGSGGSTLFWAKRVRSVISIEHDSDWANEVALQIKNHRYNHVRLLLIPPDEEVSFFPDDVANPNAYMSYMVSASFERYVKSIDEYPDGAFDFIVIDGRARPACLKHAIAKVKPGGYIVLDDSDRERYHPALQQVPDSFSRRDFVGPRLYERAFTKTSIWQRCW